MIALRRTALALAAVAALLSSAAPVAAETGPGAWRTRRCQTARSEASREVKAMLRFALVAALVLASCAATPALTPLIVDVTQPPPTLTPTPTPAPTPTPIPATGIIGESMEVITAELGEIGFTFVAGEPLDGQVRQDGTRDTRQRRIVSVLGDPVVWVAFRQGTGNGDEMDQDGLDGLGYLLDRRGVGGATAMTWVLEKFQEMADTGGLVNDRQILNDGVQLSFESEFGNGEIIYTVTLEGR